MPRKNPLYTKRITVERPTFGKDAAGGMTETWAALSAATTNIWAMDVQKRMSEKDQTFDRADWVQEVEWVCGVVCGARPGDRVKYTDAADTSHYYEIVSAHDFSNDYVTTEVVYVLKTHLRKVSSGI